MTTPVGVRRLGLFSATTLVVASMVGTGVFTTSGFLLADLQSPWLVLLAWLVGGGLATCGTDVPATAWMFGSFIALVPVRPMSVG